MEKISVNKGFGPKEATYLLSRAAVRALDVASATEPQNATEVESEAILLNIFRNLVVAFAAIEDSERVDYSNAANQARKSVASQTSAISSRPGVRELYIVGNLSSLATSSILSNDSGPLIVEMENFLKEFEIDSLLDEFEYDAKTFDASENTGDTPRIWRTVLRRVSQPSALTKELETNPSFDFWREWLQRRLNGVSLEAKIESKIAAIPDEDWRKGADHVAELIAGLQEALLQENLVLPEEMFLNERTGKLFVVPKQHPNSKIYEDSIERVREAIEDYLPQGSNALSQGSFAVRLLKRAIEKYVSNPYRVHQDFLIAADTIRREIEIGDLPASDTGIDFLLSALEEAAADIRAAMPEVQEAVAVRAQLRFKEASREEKQKFLRAAEMLETISSGDLALEVAEDSTLLASDEQDPQSKSAMFRLASRLSRSTKVIQEVEAEKRVAYVGAAIAALSAAVLSSLFGF